MSASLVRKQPLSQRHVYSPGRLGWAEKQGGTSQPRRGQGKARLLGSSHGSESSERGRSSGSGKAKKRGAASEREEEASPEAVMMETGGDTISFPPALVANTALSSLNIHSGILLLEDAIMRTGKDNASSESAAAATSDAVALAGRGKRGARASAGGGTAAATAGGEGGRGGAVVDVEKGQQDSWLQLSKLYAALGERDALVGVAARASRLDGTRCGRNFPLSSFSAANTIPQELQFFFPRKIGYSVLNRFIIYI